jgi:hypothetical protein
MIRVILLKKFKSIFWLSLMFASMLTSVCTAQAPEATDLLVYGGTAAGVMTAYSAARQGLHVILLEPGTHLGGMVSGGLSATDMGNPSVIGGYARAFYLRAAHVYGKTELKTAIDWRPEPHVAEESFGAMLRETGVRVEFHRHLRELHGVDVRGKRIVSVVTDDGVQWSAKVFADCSYEGDLMAQAGVAYTWGRESSSIYGEALAGVREETPKHQFLWPLPAYDEQHKLYPEVHPGPMDANGAGDRKVQAYNFRLILTRDPDDRLPFPKPVGYDPSQFRLLARYLKEFPAHMGREPRVGDLMNPVPIANHKADFNNNGPLSTDFIGHSWAYPESSYATRNAIREAHLRYTQSFIYFLANDSAVPPALREEMRQWGLPKDEFKDSGHWPWQLYVREGRRMIGAYVMTQSDLQTQRTKPDSIGMGSYNSDSHNTDRVAMADGTVRNEGDVQVPVKPYEISYRAITPRPEEVLNLLVPVCFSASHVAYSSIRMEPQYMIVGQAAGVAAALAVRDRIPVQQIDLKALAKELEKEGAILHIDQATAAPSE